MNKERSIKLVEAKEEDVGENYREGVEDFGEDENVPPSDPKKKW